MFRFRSTPLPFCSVIKIIRELGDFELKDFGGHGTAFKFAALFVDAEQTEVHGTDIFCRDNVNRALRRSLAPKALTSEKVLPSETALTSLHSLTTYTKKAPPERCFFCVGEG